MPASMCANGATWAGSPARASTRAWSGASAQRRCGRVLDLEQARHRLLLEPLAGVARRDAGALGQLVRRQRAVALERGVEAELDPEVDGEQLEGAERRAEQALGEGVGAVDGSG